MLPPAPVELGLDLDPVALPLLFPASPPVPDEFLSSEHPGNVIPPAKMIAVPNGIPLLMVSSSRSGLAVTLAIVRATHMPSTDIQPFAVID